MTTELGNVYEVTEAILHTNNPGEKRELFDSFYDYQRINQVAVDEQGQRVLYTAYSFPEASPWSVPMVSQFLLNVAAIGDAVWTNTQVQAAFVDHRTDFNVFILRRVLDGNITSQ